MAISMSSSNFGMSVSQIIIGVAWLVQGDYKERLASVKHHKSIWVFWIIYAMHIIGCFYSTDMHYAMNDLRGKVPLFIFPFLILTMPVLTKRQYHLILQFFVAGVIVSSIISFFVWLRIIPAKIRDTRDISIFISHIRLSLMVVLAIFISSYFAFLSKYYLKKIGWTAAAIWLIIFLFILESLTGLFIMCVILFVLAGIQLVRSKKYIPLSLMFLLAACTIVWSSFYFINQMNALGKCNENESPPAEKFTPNGNPYQHVQSYKGCENGHRLGWYICWNELRKSWNERSKFSFDSLDNRKQPLPYTLIRYLTSKNLHKDSAGVYALSNDDLKAVEQGIANCTHVDMNGLQLRFVEIAYELNQYKKTGNASGFSIAQRIEYNKGSWNILKHHLLFGVGTGDNKIAFENYYNTTNSKLGQQWRLRSHNQYMAIAVSFGMVGLALFIFALLYPVIKLNAHRHFIFLVFFSISLLSFFNEDTLETQAGITFFIFFYAVILWGYLRKV